MVKKKRAKTRAKATIRRTRRVIKKAVRKATPKRSKARVTRKRVRTTKTRVARLEKKVVAPLLVEKEVGYISHYFSGIGVGIIELTEGMLKVGDKIHIKGQTTDITQRVASMQFDHKTVEDARTGQSVGIKVNDRVREHDKVYKVK